MCLSFQFSLKGIACVVWLISLYCRIYEVKIKTTGFPKIYLQTVLPISREIVNNVHLQNVLLKLPDICK